MERALRIESYRNIGFKDGKPSNERLVINNSLNKGELGDLIILIGANNSGKSNVLDALSIFENSKIAERDITDLYMEEECRKPSLTLFARDKTKQDDFAFQRIYKQKDEIIFPEKDDEKELEYITTENLMAKLSELASFQQHYIGGTSLANLCNSIKSSSDGISAEKIKEIVNNIFTELSGIIHDCSRYPQLKNNEIIKEYSIYRENINKDKRIIINEKYNSKYGYDFIPKVLPYENQDITNNDLYTDYNDISNSDFFTSVFSAIDSDLSTLNNTYETFKKQKNKGVLSQLEKKINKKLKTVSDKFNKLYYMDDGNYSFNIDLESENIFFSLFRGEQALSLDYQSTGFKWFFNLFFNLLNSTDLNPGDIIIMDEPATNLHVKGQRELRGFLKEFAIKNDITIVIATHSPFLIDLDYLDEIRVIVNKDNISSIENNFAAVNENDPDSLLPIKESLTVENYILVNPDEKVVFVEGITDYNYLTAFKKLFEKKGIYFLPINGVGKTKDDCIKITQRLMKIRKKDPILLVDNDKAGSCMKEVNKDNKDFKVISLKEINDSFKEIESLFAKDDLEKFNLIDSDGQIIKHASTSSVFKNHILKNIDSITDETKKNFKNLFDKLEELTE